MATQIPQIDNTGHVAPLIQPLSVHPAGGLLPRIGGCVASPLSDSMNMGRSALARPAHFFLLECSR